MHFTEVNFDFVSPDGAIRIGISVKHFPVTLQRNPIFSWNIQLLNSNRSPFSADRIENSGTDSGNPGQGKRCLVSVASAIRLISVNGIENDAVIFSCFHVDHILIITGNEGRSQYPGSPVKFDRRDQGGCQGGVDGDSNAIGAHILKTQYSFSTDGGFLRNRQPTSIRSLDFHVKSFDSLTQRDVFRNQ